MPIFDVSGSLKVVGDRAGNLEIRDPAGTTIATAATFLQFSGTAISSVALSSTGVNVTVNGGSGGGTLIIDGGNASSTYAASPPAIDGGNA